MRRFADPPRRPGGGVETEAVEVASELRQALVEGIGAAVPPHLELEGEALHRADEAAALGPRPEEAGGEP